MKNKFKLGLSTLALIILFIGCKSSGSKENSDIAPSTTVDLGNMENHPGRLTYKKFCQSCHQTNGTGVPGMYPPLAENETVAGNKARVIDIVLNGMSGEIEVQGEIYNNVMPSNKHLSDQQIADVITYIRNSFGNAASAISAQEVAKVREEP